MKNSDECDENGLYGKDLPPCSDDNYLPYIPEISQGEGFHIELYPAQS